MRLFLTRLVAFVLDWIVLFVIFVAPQIAIMAITGTWFLSEDSSHILTYAWVGVSVTLPSLAYFTLCDHARRGMTVGKRLLGLAARSTGGGRMSAGQALARNIVKLLPWELTHIMIYFPEPFTDDDPSPGKTALMMLSSGAMAVWLIAPLADRPQYRAIHDRVAHSRVVATGVTGDRGRGQDELDLPAGRM